MADAAALQVLLDTPAMPPPAGVTATFDDPPNRNGLAVAIITLTMVIATICLLLRAYARVWLLRKVGIEEVLIFTAYVVYWAQTYCCYALLSTPGYFVHQWNLKLGQLVSTGYNVLLIGSFYQVVLPLLKSAILLEWIRLFVPRGNRLRSPFFLGCVFVMTLQIVWGVVCVILLNVQCTPHEAIWKFWLRTQGRCFNLVPVQLTSGCVQLCSDVIMMLLPQRIIWSLQLDTKKRLGLSVLFGLGVLASVSAAFRLAVTVTFGYHPDQMFTLGPVVFWVMAETTCGFFIVCMPCLPKIFKDAGLVRRVKQRLGLKVTAAGKSGASGAKYNRYDFGGSGVSARSKTAAPAKEYRQLDEEGGVPMGKLHSESTEQLREPRSADDTYAQSKIMRTTHVTVQVGDAASRSGSDVDSPNALASPTVTAAARYLGHPSH